ncbi:hypothetical protein H072_11466 [Dactylellina haptotyla CBS 200.50]|uniref:Uncharacterized protein n=1 Tax=Dactylellina haptotyla (strain CBS 200.50) TaxID=1284197 RepID=S8BIL7_DACHA|nr:hypothetical protein H072_11466 [Dactylellina haptotyla CBS 200.50]
MDLWQFLEIKFGTSNTFTEDTSTPLGIQYNAFNLTFHSNPSLRHITFEDTRTWDIYRTFRLSYAYSSSIYLFPKTKSIYIPFLRRNEFQDADECLITSILKVLHEKSPTIYRNLESITLDSRDPLANYEFSFGHIPMESIPGYFEPISTNEISSAERLQRESFFRSPLSELAHPDGLQEITIMAKSFGFTPDKNLISGFVAKSAQTLKRLSISGSIDSRSAMRTPNQRHIDFRTIPIYPALRELEIVESRPLDEWVLKDVATVCPKLAVLKLEFRGLTSLRDRDEYDMFPELPASGLIYLKEVRFTYWNSDELGKVIHPDATMGKRKFSNVVSSWVIKGGMKNLERVEFRVKERFDITVKKVRTKVVSMSCNIAHSAGDIINGFGQVMVMVTEETTNGLLD